MSSMNVAGRCLLIAALALWLSGTIFYGDSSRWSGVPEPASTPLGQAALIIGAYLIWRRRNRILRQL